MFSALKRIVPARARHVLSRLRRRREEFPQIVKVKTLSLRPCRFEVPGELERDRILYFGDEEQFLRQFLAEIRPGDIVFDLGSCLGLYAVPAALSGATVVAFEPDPSFRFCLKRNLELNALTRSVSVVEWAVSDSKGEAVLFTDGLGGSSPSLAAVAERGRALTRTDSLDGAVGRGNIPRPNLVKMDIEGAEILALRGMKALLSAPDGPRRLFVEFHPEFLPSFGSTVDECIALLQSLGYEVESTDTREEQVHCIFGKRHLA